MLERTVATARFLAGHPVANARTGRTPHTVIHRDRRARLLFFAPAEAKHAPVFVCMPLINTWTIFDLLPGRSVIEALVGAGVPVYLMDWGRPGPEDADVTFSDLADTVLRRVIDRALRHAAVRQMDAIGYCVGGTFLAVHLARHTDTVRRVAFLATPIDFRASGRLARWADPATFPLDTVVDSLGNFPADLMKTSFAWLRPMGNSAKWVSLWERVEDPAYREVWAAMEQWNTDPVDFPGEAYREYVRRCYFDNALVNGGWMLAGTPVDLKKATIPALVLAAADDHIVPEAAAFALERAWGGPVTTKTLKGGHVGVCIGKALPTALLEWIRA